MSIEFIAKTIISKVDFLKKDNASINPSKTIKEEQDQTLLDNQDLDSKDNSSEIATSSIEKFLKKIFKNKKIDDEEKIQKPKAKEKVTISRQDEIRAYLQSKSSVPDYIISKLIDYLEQMQLLDMDMSLIEKSALSIFELHNQMATHFSGPGNISNYLARFDHDSHITMPSQVPDNYWQNRIGNEGRINNLGHPLH